MKKKQSVWNERGTKPVLLAALVVGLLLWIGVESAFPESAGWGQSFRGVYWHYAYTHDTECDSGSVEFSGIDDDTITITPSELDSLVLLYDSLLLPTVGDYLATIIYYERGSATPDTILGVWSHVNSTRPIFLTAPTAANTCNVFGYIQDGAGYPIVGAQVWGVRVGTDAGIDTSSTTTIVDDVKVYAPGDTDTTGLFQLYLRKTTSFSDTTKGFFNITAEVNGQPIFTVERFYVPDQDSVNIGDTILGRSD